MVSICTYGECKYKVIDKCFFSQNNISLEDQMETAREEEKQMIPLYSLLPPQVRRRIKALKKLQYETTQLEARYYQDVHKLECKYSALYSELFNRRTDIVRGKVEPTDKECEFNEGYESPDDNDQTVKDLRGRLNIVKDLQTGACGIPEFWLMVLKNARQTYDLIQPHDEPILRHLVDVKSTLQTDPMGFTITFHFTENPFFGNRLLTKEYEMSCFVDERSPWSFYGPQIVRSKGCTIDWKPGMDVTQKTIHKKDKQKKKIQPNIEVNVVENESFFHFFNPPKVEDDGEQNDELECRLAEDYSIGVFLREKLVPHAVLYYTGEAPDDETTDESDTESDECYEEESDEAEEEEAPGEGEGDAQ